MTFTRGAQLANATDYSVIEVGSSRGLAANDIGARLKFTGVYTLDLSTYTPNVGERFEVYASNGNVTLNDAAATPNSATIFNGSAAIVVYEGSGNFVIQDYGGPANALIADGSLPMTGNLDLGGNDITDSAGNLLRADGTVALTASLDFGANAPTNVSGVIVYVNHGGTAGTARPANADVVYWVGSVDPTNAVAGDLFYDTSA